jgi:hypothetical protein
MSDREHRFALPLVVLAALAARVPFLSAGFGIDSDAWRVGLAARFIRATGTYGSSRVPGHPVQDVVAALLVPLGPLGLNGATTILSLVAIVFFHRLARRTALPHPVPLTLAFAFLPLVWLHSVNALDYLWALAFLLGAADAFLGRRFVLAGILLGVASGCRITSFALLLPLIVAAAPRERGRALLVTGGVAAAVAALCYVPVLWAYGPGYLRVEPTTYPRAAFIAKGLSLDVFGAVGLVGLAATLAAEALARRRAPREPAPPEWRRVRLLAAAAAVVFVLLFLKLPDDAAYLLPAVPFGLLALATILSPRRLLALCLCLVLSGFVVKVREVRRIGGPDLSPWSVRLSDGLAVELPGAVFADRARRRSEEAFADSTLARVARLPAGSALFTADWYPILAYKAAHPTIFQYPTREQIAALQARGAEIRFLPDVARGVREKTGIDLVAAGARELDPWEGRMAESPPDGR